MNQTTESFASLHVAFLGLGLMGGSLALGLRGRCRVLSAYDPDPTVQALAASRQVVDLVAPDPASALQQADLVILAAPVRAILQLLRQLPDWLPGPAVVLDLGSTKREIVQAMDSLPPRFDPVGGHPMCGKETNSLANADPAIFLEANFALTPLERTSHRARRLAEELCACLGSRPFWLDAGTHDAWTAATSHLPYLAAVALSLATPVEASPLAGPGFSSATRLAESSPAMMLDVLATNRDRILEGLGRYRQQLDKLERLLAQDTLLELKASLAMGANRRREMLAAPRREAGPK